MFNAHIVFAIILAHSCIILSSAASPNHKSQTAVVKPSDQLNLARRKSYSENFNGLTQADFKQLEENGECQTDNADRSKSVPAPMLKTCCHMAKKLGFSAPHAMLVVNDSSLSLAEIGSRTIAGKQYKVIGLNLSELTKYKKGAAYLTLGHEWAHELYRIKGANLFAYKAIHSNEQAEEVFCDRTAALARDCKTCTEEFMQHFIDRHNDESKHEGEANITLASVRSIKDIRLGSLIASATSASRKIKTTHPSHLERIFRLEQIARGIKHSCSIHKPKTIKK